jgi:hypothetical protein
MSRMKRTIIVLAASLVLATGIYCFLLIFEDCSFVLLLIAPVLYLDSVITHTGKLLNLYVMLYFFAISVSVSYWIFMKSSKMTISIGISIIVLLHITFGWLGIDAFSREVAEGVRLGIHGLLSK